MRDQRRDLPFKCTPAVIPFLPRTHNQVVYSSTKLPVDLCIDYISTLLFQPLLNRATFRIWCFQYCGTTPLSMKQLFVFFFILKLCSMYLFLWQFHVLLITTDFHHILSSAKYHSFCSFCWELYWLHLIFCGFNLNFRELTKYSLFLVLWRFTLLFLWWLLWLGSFLWNTKSFFDSLCWIVRL